MVNPGFAIAGYEVGRRIAVGGMGELYLSRHLLLDRLDVLKVLRPSLVGDEVVRRRFRREAVLAARLRHPNVAAVYSAGEQDGVLYLALEYVAGEDLADLLAREHQLAPDRVAGLVLAAADALDATHRAGLVHCDVKPRNLVVRGVGTPHETLALVDFGSSWTPSTGPETEGDTGTVAYCAPERLARRKVTSASDQYALACIAYECLTGLLPVPGHLSTVDSAEADAVLARGLAADPVARYPSCGAFAAALASALSRGGGR